MVEENGGTILGGVSSKLNYLVVGDDAVQNGEGEERFRQSGSLIEMIFLKMLQQ
jgi:DNA ligase (NAD+)